MFGFGFGGFGQEQIIINNGGMGRNNTTIIEERGGFGRREEVIINNGRRGMGGGTTIIQQRGGLFGPRQEIIVNNGGMGMGGGTTIIEQRGGMFGPRQQIIINDGMGYGMGGTTIIEQGGMFGGEQIIINNGGMGGYGMCPPGCTRACCTNLNSGYGGYGQQGMYRQQQFNNQQNQYQQRYNNQMQYQNRNPQRCQQPQQQQQQNYPNYQNSPRNPQNRGNYQQNQGQYRNNNQQKNQLTYQQNTTTQQKSTNFQYNENVKVAQKAPKLNEIKQKQVSQQSNQYPQLQQPIKMQPNIEKKTQNIQVVKQSNNTTPNVASQILIPNQNQKASEPKIKQVTQTKPVPQQADKPKVQPKPIQQHPMYAEIGAFAYFINRMMKGNPELKGYLPISANNFFTVLQDGVIYCKIINKSFADSLVPPIAPMAINIKPNTQRLAIENINIAIDSAKSLGCYMAGINAKSLLSKKQQTILSFIWELILIYISNQVCFKKYPQILLLKNKQESDEAFKNISSKQIFIRWLSYHLKMQGITDKTVKNLSKDLVDCDAYGNLFASISTINPDFWQKTNADRAKLVLQKCYQLKIDAVLLANDIISSKPHMHTMLCYDIFKIKNGLQIEIPQTQKSEPETLKQREIQMYTNWINTLGLKGGLTINYLMDDLQSGRILLAIIDKLRPGSVDWKKYSNKVNSRIHTIQNCNYACQLCAEQLGIKLINISGTDIVDKKINLVLGLVWQICKVYWQQRVGKIRSQEIVNWANSKVPQRYRVGNLQDKSLGSGMYIMYVVESIKPKTVDFSKLKQLNCQENQVANINYCLACVRKLGAEVMSLWQHIKEVDSRFIALILAELYRIEKASQPKS